MNRKQLNGTRIITSQADRSNVFIGNKKPQNCSTNLQANGYRIQSKIHDTAIVHSTIDLISLYPNCFTRHYNSRMGPTTQKWNSVFHTCRPLPTDQQATFKQDCRFNQPVGILKLVYPVTPWINSFSQSKKKPVWQAW